MSETISEYIAGERQSELREKLNDMTVGDMRSMVDHSDHFDEYKENLKEFILDNPEIYDNYFN